MKVLQLLLTAALLAMGLAGTAAPAAAQKTTTSTVGSLKCDVAGSLSFVFGSTRELHCVYSSSGRPVEYYGGRIQKFGIDIGFQQGGVILWGVVSPAVQLGPGALTGTYVGASAEVAAGAGLGANALVGTNKIMLNPLSVSGVQGINVAAGITSIELYSR